MNTLFTLGPPEPPLSESKLPGSPVARLHTGSCNSPPLSSECYLTQYAGSINAQQRTKQ